MLTVYFKFSVFNWFELVETNLLFKFIDQGVSLLTCSESGPHLLALDYFILTYPRVQGLW